MGVQSALEEKRQSLIAVADLLPYHTTRNAQENLSIAFELAARMELDCYIVPVGIVDAYTTGQQYQSEYFIDMLPRSKTLILENDIDGYRCITKNNEPGMRECMRYLIHKKGYRKIGFISGPETSRGARARERFFFEEMEKTGLAVLPGQFARGDFNGLCEDVVIRMLNDNPEIEAIACACDESAFTAYRVLRERGLTVGKDVAITGFDDLPRAAMMDPPLSTVNMAADRLGYEAGLEAIRLCEGKPMHTRQISSKFVRRASCGETGAIPIEEGQDDSAIRMLYEARRNEVYALKRREWTTLQIVDDALRESEDSRLVYRQILEDFQTLGVKNAEFLMFAEPLKYTPGQRFVINHKAVLQGSIRNGAVELPESDGMEIKLSQVLSRIAVDGELSDLYTVGGLMANHELFGLMLVESDSLDDDGQMMALIMIGYALKHIQMIRNEKEMVALLNRHNLALQRQSFHDEMTGLLNRRGYMMQVKAKLLDFQGQYGAVVFLDLDGLKTINDTYGHEKGDEAIWMTSELLKECLRENDLLARLGGDEFVAFLIIKEREHIRTVIERIQRHFAAYNEEKQPVYTLSISSGYHIFQIDQDTSGRLSSYLAMADEMLYKEKRHKKQSRRGENIR